MSGTKLTRLRESLTEVQRRVLDQLWRHVERSGKAMPQRAFYFEFSRDEVDPEIDSLGGNVIIQNYVDGTNCYAPTLVGALLSSNGPALDDLLCRCLQFLKDRYEADPEIRSLSSEQLERGGGLTSKEVDCLRRLLTLAANQLVILHGGGATDGPWTILVRDEVDRLRKVGDWLGYLHDEVMKGFDRNYPVSEAQRVALMQSPLGWLDRIDRPHPETSSTFVEQDELSFDFVEDEGLRGVLASDWNEMCMVLSVNAFKSCAILCGGMIEGLLLSIVLRLTESDLREAMRDAEVRNSAPHKMGIADLLKICESKRLVDAQRLHLGEFVRLYRNLIHPGTAGERQTQVGENEAKIAVLAVKSISETLSRGR
jgi:hypothetical protein